MSQMPPPPSGGNSKRVSAGVLGILLGALGVHKFVLGYSKAGVIMLLVSIIGSVFLFLGPIVMGIIGLVEGIIYLTKSDAEFHNTYVANKKEWF
jgi:TM2 domain-containing membrane protein YozV